LGVFPLKLGFFWGGIGGVGGFKQEERGTGILPGIGKPEKKVRELV